MIDNYSNGLVLVSTGLSAALIVLATAFGISKIAKHSVQSMARQPETADKIRTAMILAGALVESVALGCAVICFMILSKI